MRFIKDLFTVFFEAGRAWSQDKASLYAAAIAYYMVFSIAPLLVFAIAIAGRIFGQVGIGGQIVARVNVIAGPQAAEFLETLLENATSGSSSFTLISMAVLLWAASGVFNHLKRSLDIIFGVIPKQIPGIKGIIFAIRYRSLSFAMVLLLALLLLTVLALNAIAATLGNYLTEFVPVVAAFNSSISRIITPFIIFFLFSIIFKTLPEARIAWRDVILGALITTLLFLLGIYFIGIYLGFSNVGSVYGAASSLIVVLVWIYYSAQIVMYGAEFVKIYANTHGRPVVPSSGATSLAEHYNNVLPDPTPEPEPETIERNAFDEQDNYSPKP